MLYQGSSQATRARPAQHRRGGPAHRPRTGETPPQPPPPANTPPTANPPMRVAVQRLAAPIMTKWLEEAGAQKQRDLDLKAKGPFARSSLRPLVES